MQFRHAKTYPTVNSGYGHFPVIIIKKLMRGITRSIGKREPQEKTDKKN